jgi:hypothetical protein
MNTDLVRMRTKHERGVAWDRDGFECERAAWWGNLECLRYAHEHGAPWDAYGATCQRAAMRGHIDCLRYAHENGAPWDAYGTTCQRAAMRGHLDCLRYAHEHGASYAGDLCWMICGNAACIRYMLCTGAAMPSLSGQLWNQMWIPTSIPHVHIPRALRNAVRALIAAWRSRRERRLAAVAKLEGAWLHPRPVI